VRRSEGILKGGDKTSRRGGKLKMLTDVHWSSARWGEVKILGEMCVLSLIRYVA